MSTNDKVKKLISLYRQNIADNKSRLVHHDSCGFMKLKFTHENDVLTDVISELAELIKLKSEK